jgi:hypothetical protein
MYEYSLHHIVWVLLLLGLFLLTGLFSVRGYEVQPGRLLIRRPFWTTVVDLSDLIEASTEPDLIRSSWSLWSTRGYFGFIGYGNNGDIGTYRAYVTNSGKAVLLRFLSGKQIVVSPESPEEFIVAVLPSLGSRIARSPPPWTTTLGPRG